MPRVIRRVLIPTAFVAVALAGCSDAPADTAAAATSVAAAPSSAAALPVSAPPSTPAPPSAGPSAAGCPVTAAALEKAFKANAKVADALVLGKGLTNVSCYQGYATASTQPTNVDVAVVLFRYDTAKKVWTAVGGGTDGVCRDAVPDAIATHLKGCQN
jgi:hypothetical protein